MAAVRTGGTGQNWSRGKTLAVTTAAGIGHVLFTILLGVLVVWAGHETSQRTGQVFPFIAGGVLILVGIYYLVRQARGGHGHAHGAHGHHHDHPLDHDHHHEDVALAACSDWPVTGGLLAMLTFSPCEGFLPVYLLGIRYGWSAFIGLSAVLAVATVARMVALTWLTLAGLERLKLEVLERYEVQYRQLVYAFSGLIVMVVER